MARCVANVARLVDSVAAVAVVVFAEGLRMCGGGGEIFNEHLINR